MPSLIELYNSSDFANLPKTGADKTPLSNDGGINITGNEKTVDTARGGIVDTKKYSETVKF